MDNHNGHTTKEATIMSILNIGDVLVDRGEKELELLPIDPQEDDEKITTSSNREMVGGAD